MTNLNQVILMGNLVRDCGANENDFGYAANGQARANITIAVNRSKKQGDEWVDETSFLILQFGVKQQKILNLILQRVQKLLLQVI